jgi:hypothetical protein
MFHEKDITEYPQEVLQAEDMKHDRNESEHHETVRGGREGAETSR